VGRKKAEYVLLGAEENSIRKNPFFCKHGRMFKVLKKMRGAYMLMSSKTKYRFVLSDYDPCFTIKSFGDYKTIRQLERGSCG
jgi:hypothetical protein